MELSYNQYIQELNSIKNPVMRKIFVNSYYPIAGHANFILYDPHVAYGVTSTGNTLISLIVNN